MPAKLRPPSEEKVKCACGHCDIWIPKYNNRGRLTTFAFGHSITKWKERENPEIECGCKCGGKLLKYGSDGKERKFLYNHHKRKEVSHDGDYEYVKVPENHPFKNHKGKVYRHRLEIEKYYTEKWGYKFYLHPSIPVHHKDDNPKNNHISNLEIKLKPQHTGDHRRRDNEETYCLFCHSETTYINPQGQQKWHKYNSGDICEECQRNYIKTYKDKK